MGKVFQTERMACLEVQLWDQGLLKTGRGAIKVEESGEGEYGQDAWGQEMLVMKALQRIGQ